MLVNKFKGSEIWVNLLARDMKLHWPYLRRPLRLHIAFIVVTFLWGCSAPSLVLCFLQRQRVNTFLILFWISVLLCLSHSSLCTWSSFSHYLYLWSMFLCSALFLEQSIGENISCLPCIFLFSFYWQKPCGCLCRAPGYTFTGLGAFLCNGSYCTSSCIGGKASTKWFASFLWPASLDCKLRVFSTMFSPDQTERSSSIFP